MIPSWFERRPSHAGTETRPRLLPAVWDFGQWAKA